MFCVGFSLLIHCGPTLLREAVKTNFWESGPTYDALWEVLRCRGHVKWRVVFHTLLSTSRAEGRVAGRPAFARAAVSHRLCRLLTYHGSEGPGETFHQAVHNGVIVLMVMELIIIAIIKRAISIYCIPNMSQVLQQACHAGLLHNCYTVVGVKAPFLL